MQAKNQVSNYIEEILSRQISKTLKVSDKNHSQFQLNPLIAKEMQNAKYAIFNPAVNFKNLDIFN